MRKKQIRRWLFTVFVTLLFFMVLLLGVILNPTLTYAHKTNYKKFTIYHSQPISPALFVRLDEATAMIANSELSDPEFNLDICLNDGSVYPGIMKQIYGESFANGFYNKVVLRGKADFEHNFVTLNDYTWNLSELLAHEITHCLQFNYFGFWHSNPIANKPDWKWEGYAELIARQKPEHQSLKSNLEHLLATQKTDNNGWIYFKDSTGSPITYYESWLMVKYLTEIKGLHYQEILQDPITEENIMQELMLWHTKEINAAKNINS